MALLPTELLAQSADSREIDFGSSAGDVAAPTVINSKGKVSVTDVYDRFWYFAAERQKIFFARYNGDNLPWTEDRILRDYNFSNVYRASNRITQYLIRNVIYNANASQEPGEVFFRTILFRLFNKIETWELLEQELGGLPCTKDSTKSYEEVLDKAKDNGQKLYSPGYILPSPGHPCSSYDKHLGHLLVLKKMLVDYVPYRIQQMKSLQEVFECLLQYPAMGEFIAYQFAIDINYSEITDFSEMEFAVPEVSVKDGINKCFTDKGDYSDADIIRLMADRQEEEFNKRGLKFETLWGRKLQLADCQCVFSEIDKYAGIAYPEIKRASGSKRYTSKFAPNLNPIDYYYPPKWKLDYQADNVRST